MNVSLPTQNIRKTDRRVRLVDRSRTRPTDMPGVIENL